MDWKIKYCDCVEFKEIDSIETCTRIIKLEPLLEADFCSLCGQKFKFREPEIQVWVSVEDQRHNWIISLKTLKELLNGTI